MGFRLPVKQPIVAAAGTFAGEGRGEPLLHELAADVLNGARVDLQGAGDHGVGPAGTGLVMIGFEQNAGARELTSGGRAAANQRAQRRPLLIRQHHAKANGHDTASYRTSDDAALVHAYGIP
jgi:hypothetical protein